MTTPLRQFPVRPLSALCLAAAACGCASMDFRREASLAPKAPPKTASERMGDVRSGVADAAITPLKDVGLVRPEIPTMLSEMNFPYFTVTLGGACSQVAYELGALDAVLGVESFQPGAKQAMSERGMDAAADAAGDAAMGAAGDLIPFRGLVRKASGAEKAAKEAARALDMGRQRRAFLRGYGAALGCPGVLPDPPPLPKPETAERR